MRFPTEEEVVSTADERKMCDVGMKFSCDVNQLRELTYPARQTAGVNLRVEMRHETPKTRSLFDAIF